MGAPSAEKSFLDFLCSAWGEMERTYVEPFKNQIQVFEKIKTYEENLKNKFSILTKETVKKNVFNFNFKFEFFFELMKKGFGSNFLGRQRF